MASKMIRRGAASWLGFGRKQVGSVVRGTSRPAPPVPPHVPRPPYADSGNPGAYMPDITELTDEQVLAMRQASAVAKDVLHLAGSLVRPGTTTLEIDDALHAATVEAGAYPSPLNYRGFPRSTCTSVNEVVCHGIPDDRPLEDGDIISIDVSVFYNGVHGDTCRTFFCGKPDDATRELVTTTKHALDAAIAECGPGVPVAHIGDVIEQVASRGGFGTVHDFVGHGIGPVFHTRPQVYHFAGSGSSEVLKEGTCFTIEPMLTAASPKVTLWRDGWTVVTADGGRSAQFEHTLLVTPSGVDVLTAYPGEHEPDVGAGPVE